MLRQNVHAMDIALIQREKMMNDLEEKILGKYIDRSIQFHFISIVLVAIIIIIIHHEFLSNLVIIILKIIHQIEQEMVNRVIIHLDLIVK
jgi:hypothetical protein